MPNILILTKMEDAKRLEPFMATIGLHLREATANALSKIRSDQVAVIVVPFIAADNMTRVQVMGIASHSAEREQCIDDWNNKLRTAMMNLRVVPELADVQDILRDEADVWPTMPVGAWDMVPAFQPFSG